MVVLVAFVIAAAAGCGGSKTPPSIDEYHASVVKARDRTEYAFAAITGPLTTAESQRPKKDVLLDRMDAAADLIDAAANDFENAGSAAGFEDESAALVKHLHQLAADLAGTADQIRTPGYEGLLDTKGLSFQSWVDINNVLASLTKQGIKVEPLGRH